MKKILLILACLFSTQTVFAGTLYFMNGGVDSNWGTLGNWSTTASTGPANAVAIPAATDDVILDANSPNVTVNGPTGRGSKSLYMKNFTQTLSVNYGLSVGAGNIDLCVSCTITGTGTYGLTIGNTGTIFTSWGKTWPLLLTVNAMTLTLGDDLHVSGTCTFTNPTINSNNLYCNGSFAMAGFLRGSTKIILGGIGTWSGGGSVDTNLEINTLGTITISGTVLWTGSVTGGAAGTLKYTHGTVLVAGSTLNLLPTITGTTVDTGGMNWNNVLHSIGTGGFIINFASNLNVMGNFTQNTPNTANVMNGGTINIGGSLIFSNMANGVISGTTNIVMSGTGNISMPLVSTIGGLRNNLEINTAGAITFVGNSGILNYGAGTFTYTNGTLNTAGTTLNLFTTGTTITSNKAGLSFNAITIPAAMNVTFNGTNGFSIGSLTATSITGNTLTLGASNTYLITSALTLTGARASHYSVLSGTPGTKAIFTLQNGATEQVAYTNATDVDSSAGITVWSFGGVLSNATNWRSFLAPATISYGI